MVTADTYTEHDQASPPGLLRFDFSLQKIHHSLGNAFAWVAAGLREILPNGMANIRMRPYGVLLDTDEQLCLSKSLLGFHQVDKRAGAPSLATFRQVSAKDVYLTSVDLPKLSRKTAKEAVRLRLGDLSPFPLTDTLFALPQNSLSGVGVRSVPIAITSRSKLNSQREEETAAFVSEQDDIFLFGETQKKSSFASIVLLIGAISVLFLGVNAYLERQTEANELHSASIISSLKQGQAQGETMSALVQALDGHQPVDVSALNSIETQFESADSDSLWLSNIRLTGNRVEITGYAGSDISLSFPDLKLQSRRSTNRPSIDQFVLIQNRGDVE